MHLLKNPPLCSSTNQWQLNEGQSRLKSSYPNCNEPEQNLRVVIRLRNSLKKALTVLQRLVGNVYDILYG
jgi:hypothetical protein